MEPKIRFKGFEGEWKDTNLGNISNNFKYGINAAAIPYDGKNKYLRITDIDDTTHVFLQDNLTSPGADLSYCDEYIMQDGDIVIARTGASVGKSYVYHTVDGKIYFAGFLIRVRTNKEVNKDFIFQKTLTNAYTKHIQFVSQRSGQPGVNVNELKSFSFQIPRDKEEQQAIASYFTTLDSQISASTSRLASLKQMKAASLQAMFPQEGETVPKIRFKGFEGEWKKVSFKDFTFHAGTKNRDNLPLESYSISNEFGFIPQNEQFENGGTMTQADKRMYYIVSPNSFAYNPARINVGSLGYYEGKEDVIVSSLYEVFKTDDTICDNFLLYWFKTDIFQKMIEQFQEGGVRLYFFYDKMCKCSLMRPSLAEQQAIASYFTSLDRQISLQSQRLEKLKQIKSACLDKMFV